MVSWDSPPGQIWTCFPVHVESLDNALAHTPTVRTNSRFDYAPLTTISSLHMLWPRLNTRSVLDIPTATLVSGLSTSPRWASREPQQQSGDGGDNRAKTSIAITIEMEATKTLPASWFTSQNLYNLEVRAVFHKAWYLIGPVTRFATNHSVDYEIAGVSLTVTHHGDESFSITRISDNTMLVHYLTPTGLLFTTISTSAPPFESWFPPSLLELLNKQDFRRLPHRRSIKYPGHFNWKTMVDGYQECLHCQYTHRSFSVKYPPTFYEVQNHGNYSRHIADPTKPDDGLFLYFFPICTLNLYGGGMSSFRVCPGNPIPDPNIAGIGDGGADGDAGKATETRMEFDYYYLSSNETDPTQGFEEYFKFVRKVAMEDFELCETAQGNLERGVYSQGVLNGEKESGVLHYQGLVRGMVLEGWRVEEQERERGRERVRTGDAEGALGGTAVEAVIAGT